MYAPGQKEDEKMHKKFHKSFVAGMSIKVIAGSERHKEALKLIGLEKFESR